MSDDERTRLEREVFDLKIIIEAQSEIIDAGQDDIHAARAQARRLHELLLWVLGWVRWPDEYATFSARNKVILDRTASFKALPWAKE